MVHVTDKQNPGKTKLGHHGHGKKAKQDKANLEVPCKFCGTNHSYARAKCPTSGKTCLKCGKQGHFAVKCRGRSVPRVLLPTKYIKQALHKNMRGEAASLNVDQKLNLII